MQSAEFKPENLHIVFKKAFQTLAELMNTLNQKQLFEMIAKKYTEVGLNCLFNIYMHFDYLGDP